MTAWTGGRPASSRSTSSTALAPSRCRRLDAARRLVRGEQHVGQRTERVVGGQRFGVEHIDRRVQLARGQFGEERVLVHQPRPGGVHQTRPVRHQRQLLGADHPAGLLGDRCVHGHDPAAREQRFEGYGLHPERLGVRGGQIRVGDAHPRAHRPHQGDVGAPGAGGTDHADVAAMDLVARRGLARRRPLQPAAQRVVEALDAVQQREREGEGHLGDRAGHLVTGLGDQDAAPEHLLGDIRGDRRTGVRHQLQPVGRFQQRGVHLGRPPRGDQRPGAGQRGRDRRPVGVLVDDGEFGRPFQFPPHLGGEELGAQARRYGDDHPGAVGRIRRARHRGAPQRRRHRSAKGRPRPPG